MDCNSLLQYILEDVRQYAGTRRFVKAGLVERMAVKKVSPVVLHPNPDDEFSMADIGPNMSIVSRYTEMIQYNIDYELPVFEEPIVVEKMLPDGYMILNGHHRWAAALQSGTGKVRIQVINVTHDEDIYRMLKSSQSDKRVILDLDEIVFAGEGDPTEPLGFPYNKIFTCRMKLGMAAFLDALKKRGYDIWAFTASEHSEKYFNYFFEAHRIKITGVVNCINQKKAARVKENKQMASAFAKKYNQTLTLLKDSMIYVKAKNYEVIEIDAYGAAKELLDQIDRVERLYATDCEG